MPEDLLDISRRAVAETDEVIKNLKLMTELAGANKTLHKNALEAANATLEKVKKLNARYESRDAAAIAGLLGGIDLSGGLSSLEQRAAQELETIKKDIGKITIPSIDQGKIKQILDALQAEIGRMKSDALIKGIGLLATIVRVAIPLL